MHRSWALVLVSSTKALVRLGLNVVTISLMNGGPFPKNNVMKSLLGEKQIVWVKVKVKASITEEKVSGVVARVAPAEVALEEVLEGVLGSKICPSLPVS